LFLLLIVSNLVKSYFFTSYSELVTWAFIYLFKTTFLEVNRKGSFNTSIRNRK